MFKEGFKDSGFALFFSFSLKQVFLLRKDSKAYDLGLSILVDIVSLLETMEKLGHLYCVGSEDEFSLFINDSTFPVAINGDRNTYDVSNGKIIISKNKIVYNDKLGNLIMDGSCVEKQLTAKIINYLCCSIYATDSLKELVENNYESLEIQSYKRQIADAKFSRNMAWIALFVSLFSPFFMTFFNNKYAKTEIKDSQYESILNHIDLITNNVISIYEMLHKDNENNKTIILNSDSINVLKSDSM